MADDKVTLANSVHSVPESATAVGDTDPEQWLEITLAVRRRKDLPDLGSLDATAPPQRSYLTQKQLIQRYGADPRSVARILAFARAHGLTAGQVDRLSSRMVLGGTVGALSAAFGVKLKDFKDPTLGDFHARTDTVSVPPEVAGDITGVFGFSNQRHLRRKNRRGDGVQRAAMDAPGGRDWFMPAELARMYSFPEGDAAGQTIALLEFGGGVERDDLTAYFAALGMPEPAVTVIGVHGTPTDPAADPASTDEVMLDIEIAGALAPGAHIVCYFSSFDEKGMIDAIAAAISDPINKPSVISISWGWAENQLFQDSVVWSPAAIDHVNHSFLAAALMGISVCVATGDAGLEAQMNDGHAHVTFPASSPYVLAVGGTKLEADGSGEAVVVAGESVWNAGPGYGTGGGVSDYTPRPAWQEGVTPASINPGAFAGRSIPDVAAHAAFDPGYYVHTDGAPSGIGGTSASAPLWAALLARINKAIGGRVGNFNALLYKSYGPGGVLRDITVGDNDTEGRMKGLFAAGPGWDACTGWGVPDGVKLLAAIRQPVSHAPVPPG